VPDYSKFDLSQAASIRESDPQKIEGQPLVQIGKTVKCLCKILSFRLMTDQFNEGLAFLERLNEAITSTKLTIERAKIQQLRALMYINRANQLERKVNPDLML
jgi:hypothetical protein